MSIEQGETYLGDAVMVSFDGHMIRLRTDDGRNHEIFLEPEVLRNFLEYVNALKQHLSTNGGP